MISICIPVYNMDVTNLVTELHQQGVKAKVNFEIILIDDASDQFTSVNENIKLEHITYVPLKKNIGRSKIRNLFLEYTQYPYLLFLDCDSLIFLPDFIQKYIDTLAQDYMVICGGRIYPDKRPERNKLLRWEYGMKKESQTADIRNLSPNKSFMTNNFIIKRDVLQKTPFDESIAGYGHEDTLLGFQLKQKGIFAFNIDNPILNNDIEDNELFLQKTEEGVKNLVLIMEKMNYNQELMSDIKITRIYNKLKKRKMIGIVHFSLRITKPLFRYFLSKGYFFLWMFDSFKLETFINAIKEKRG